jgi:sugar fermentation stimulation protein A
VSVKISGEKVKGTLIERINRFEAYVKVDGKDELVHVPNTGRMAELMNPGAEVLLVGSKNPNRKTAYSLIFVYKGPHLICINSILANREFEDGLFSGRINWLNGRPRREVTYKNSRFDFLVEGEKNTFVEVKCGTFEKDGILMFPDAPTERGRRHIDEIIDASKNGYGAGIAIIGFMDYIKAFTPYYQIDRKFGEKLKEAAESGVVVKAYRSSITSDEVSIIDEIEVYF